MNNQAKPPRILVVEDEVHILRLLKIVLSKNDFHVDTAGSGEDALQMLKTGTKPDLILLDILMPGMDGLTVLRTLKSINEFKDIPIVMLTALAQENIVMQGIRLGAKDYIRKPFHPGELGQRLAKHLGRETKEIS